MRARDLEKNVKDLEHQELLEEFRMWQKIAIGGILGIVTNILVLPLGIKVTALILSSILIGFSMTKIGETKLRLEKVRTQILEIM